MLCKRDLLSCSVSVCPCVSVCLSVTFVGPMSLIISTFVCLSFVFVCQYIIDTAKCPSVFLLHVCIYQSIHLSVRPSVCPSVTRWYSVDTTQHIRNFYRATHMHSADYAEATCLSDRSSLCLSDSPSVCHTTSLPPCTHVFLSSSFFVSVFQYTCLYPSHSYAQCLPYMSVFLRPYVRISCSQLCVRVSVCHIQVYYTSLSYISTTVCRSMCLCVCLYSCKYILHVQLFVRLFVTFVRHPLNTCLCV